MTTPVLVFSWALSNCAQRFILLQTLFFKFNGSARVGLSSRTWSVPFKKKFVRAAITTVEDRERVGRDHRADRRCAVADTRFVWAGPSWRWTATGGAIASNLPFLEIAGTGGTKCLLFLLASPSCKTSAIAVHASRARFPVSEGSSDMTDGSTLRFEKFLRKGCLSGSRSALKPCAPVEESSRHPWGPIPPRLDHFSA